MTKDECLYCDGTGFERTTLGGEIQSCDECNGLGYIPLSDLYDDWYDDEEQGADR